MYGYGRWNVGVSLIIVIDANYSLYLHCMLPKQTKIIWKIDIKLLKPNEKKYEFVCIVFLCLLGLYEEQA